MSAAGLLPDIGNPYGRPLTDADYASLSARSISREFADRALIKRVSHLEAKEQVAWRGGDCAGLLIPYIWPGDPGWRNVRIRRDNPDIESGKLKNKYISAPKSGNKAYLVPGVELADLEDPGIPLIVTEGEFKTIALERLALLNGGRQFLPIGISGAWNWRGNIGKVVNDRGVRVDEKGPISDLARIAWKDRQVIIALDADAADNSSVRAAKYQLSKELRSRGAVVGQLEWDLSQGKGVDDWIATVGADAVLKAIASVDFNRTSGWRAKLAVSENGKVKADLRNIAIAFRHSEEWAGALAFDEFRQQIRVLRDCPIPGPVPRDWNDADTTNATKWLQGQGIGVGTETTGKEVWALAWENRFNPLRDWLQSLHWDGTKRVDTWLFDYLGAQPSENRMSGEYLAQVGRMWLVSAVARVMRPGEKVDTMLVLEGKQGAGKSKALRILAGDEYFCDSMPDIHSKDAQLQVFGSWIIEWGELDAMSRAETTAVKAFISRQEEKLRRPYGHQTERVPRQCVFAGTTNTTDYLRDETGNRRFWPVSCGVIDCERLAADRDQLWAEAVELYTDRAKWWIENPTVLQVAMEEQLARVQADPWEEAIARFVRNDEAVKCEAVLQHLGINLADMTQAHRNRAGRCLTVLGFESKYTRTMGRCYQRVKK